MARTVSAQSQAIQQQVGGLVQNPQLPQGAAVNPQMQQIGQNELMTTPGAAPIAPQASTTASQAPTAPTATAQGAGTSATQQAITPTTATSMTAAAAGLAPQMTAAEHTTPLTQEAVGQAGTITDPATVRGQLKDITTDIENALAAGSPLPSFARGAQKMAMAAMAQRGLSASTIAADAVAEGVLRASTQIAAADAQTYKDMIFQNLNNRQQAMMTNAQNYFQLDVQNLSNRQQAALTNTQIKQSFMLSDQAATNAARQFNATNQQQTDQFFSQLNASIQESNSKRSDAMNQFNSAEVNKLEALNTNNAVAVEEANAARRAQIEQFNAGIQDQRDRFNVENQMIVDQSNVEWRRAINTANTAEINAANQINAQNQLDLSNYALNALWQQWRDEASWAQTEGENAKNRAHNLAIAAMERATTFDIMDEQKKAKLLELLGSFAVGMWATSDIRFKTNIIYIGQHTKGFGIYMWQWNSLANLLGITGPTIGVLAQELLSYIPKAVARHPQGYLQVNYSLLGE